MARQRRPNKPTIWTNLASSPASPLTAMVFARGPRVGVGPGPGVGDDDGRPGRASGPPAKADGDYARSDRVAAAKLAIAPLERRSCALRRERSSCRSPRPPLAPCFSRTASVRSSISAPARGWAGRWAKDGLWPSPPRHRAGSPDAPARASRRRKRQSRLRRVRRALCQTA